MMTMAHETESWRQLQLHQTQLRTSGVRIKDLFTDDPDRYLTLSAQCGGLLADFSKHLITPDTRTLLLQLSEETGLPQAIAALFAGEAVNNTENRPALHMALRGHVPALQKGVAKDVDAALQQMQKLVTDVRNGSWTGSSGKAITDVVNIGIGGSDLGPAMVTDALNAWQTDGPRCHFVSNVDPAHMRRCLQTLDANTTLFIVASKSFGTLETMQNANLARRWFRQQAGEEARLHQHFIAVTANTAAAADFGIQQQNIFPMWDWVGGRFSLWSAIGLPIALATGMDAFRQLLAGAAQMDTHFRDTPLQDNIPVMMGLLAVWYRNFWQAGSHVVLPYAQDLAMLPGFLQQLEMESLGKGVRSDGTTVTEHSGPVIWGSAGTNGQHSFHQLLHQGTQMVPADFIAIAQPHSSRCQAEDLVQHQHLLANCFSQSRALMDGKSLEQSTAELLQAGFAPEQATELAPHKVVPGNRPSTTLALDALTPFNLGSLIALYEHKVFVQSVIWHINAFDQWGVEIGKQLGKPAFAALCGDRDALAKQDASSAALIQFCRQQAQDRHLHEQ